MLQRDETLFVLVDVQGKLAEIVHDSTSLIENLRKLIQACTILNIPIIWLEQYPEGLGPTTKSLSSLLPTLKPLRKITFDGCKTDIIKDSLIAAKKKQALIAGIEAHICVYQTALGLKKMGYEVEVAVDAVSSRTKLNKEIGLEKMKAAGIGLTGVETAVFELMEIAEGNQFKQIIQLFK